MFAIHSGNQSLLVLGDTAQHPAVFARHPDWQAAFDIDGSEAVATRKKIFDRAAADRMLVTGYHFPFPACGHLIKTATGYEHVPVEWQPNLLIAKDRRPAVTPASLILADFSFCSARIEADSKHARGDDFQAARSSTDRA